MSERVEAAVFRLVCLLWLASKYISLPLWLGDRDFPIVPAFDFLPVLPPVIHAILLGFSTVCLGGLLLFPMRRNLLIAVIVAEITSCLSDMVRWQPWEHFFLIFTIIYCVSKPEIRRSALLLLLGFCYVYSGLHKFGDGFQGVWNGMFVRRFFSADGNAFFRTSGFFVPIIETSIGFGLLLSPKKRFFAYLAIAMHAFLLVVLMRLHYNVVVWPWNVAMIALNVLVSQSMGKWKFRQLGNPIVASVIILCGVLPMLNFVGKWHDYLSFNLYSGERLRAEMEVSANEEIFGNCDRKASGQEIRNIDLKCAAFSELHVPPYPEAHYYRKLEKRWREKYPESRARMVISGK